MEDGKILKNKTKLKGVSFYNSSLRQELKNEFKKLIKKDG